MFTTKDVTFVKATIDDIKLIPAFEKKQVLKGEKKSCRK